MDLALLRAANQVDEELLGEGGHSRHRRAHPGARVTACGLRGADLPGRQDRAVHPAHGWFVNRLIRGAANVDIHVIVRGGPLTRRAGVESKHFP